MQRLASLTLFFIEPIRHDPHSSALDTALTGSLEIDLSLVSIGPSNSQVGVSSSPTIRC